MARTLGPVCKRCRREGKKLFLKGVRCDSKACPFEKAGDKKTPLPPGMHGMKRGKMTEYGEQLREKQKVKTYYGVLEAQFRKYYQMAERSKGNTGEILLSLLERRLDNVVYRFGFAVSRAQARQMIAHGHVCVNGKRLDVPSYLVRPGDAVSMKVFKRQGKKAGNDASKGVYLVITSLVGNGDKKEAAGTMTVLDATKNRDVPDYLSRNEGEVPSGVVMRYPLFDDVDKSLDVRPQLIVELCSK
ncbi:MAG: 30S ribosomal protein S4 [Thermoguttaceae bacterium]|nr:30S ribosomal protein S4 [Thermoguttaceae bacterium]